MCIKSPWTQLQPENPGRQKGNEGTSTTNVRSRSRKPEEAAGCPLSLLLIYSCYLLGGHPALPTRITELIILRARGDLSRVHAFAHSVLCPPCPSLYPSSFWHTFILQVLSTTSSRTSPTALPGPWLLPQHFGLTSMTGLTTVHFTLCLHMLPYLTSGERPASYTLVLYPPSMLANYLVYDRGSKLHVERINE